MKNSYLFRKIECFRRILRSSWFNLPGYQLTGSEDISKNLSIGLVSDVRIRTQQTETTKTNLPDLQSWTFSLNFWVEFSFINFMTFDFIGIHDLLIVLVRTKSLFWKTLRKFFLFRKWILTSWQTSWQQHSRKRLYMLTSSISNRCCVLRRGWPA